MYTNQRLRVRWRGDISGQFDVINGVNQGRLLSPLLFAVFIDVFLIRLKATGMGCHMGICFISAFVFADDHFLLTPTVSGLKVLIDVFKTYAEFNIKFNG